jgi:hypothetical protein
LKRACSIRVAPPAPELLGPGDARPAGVVHLLLPGAAELELGRVVALGRGAGVVGLEPGAYLFAELRLGLGR